MKRRLYFVDWDDSAYPQIVPTEDYTQDAKTFTECKQEIIDHFQCRIDDYRYMIAHTRRLRVRDVSDN